MKTYKERTDIILEKVTTKKKKQKALLTSVGAGISTCALALGLFLFVPFNNTPPSVDEHKESEYYAIIEKLNILTYDKPIYNNNFDIFSDMLIGSMAGTKGEDMNGGAAPEYGIDINLGFNEDFDGTFPENSNSYEETTDNQVAGIIEGDRIKRSSQYIYYMNSNTLSIYSIEGENSKLISSFIIEDKDGYKLSAYEHEWEMFLSKDCTTVTLLSSAYHNETDEKYVCLVSFDVSDPTNITETKRTYLSGSYLSARLVDDEILLISHYRVSSNPDFSKPETFVPQYGTLGSMKCVPGKNIIAPEELSSTLYTVICKIDEKTLEAKSTAAFLSYAEEVYVSSDKVYATRSYSSKEEIDGYSYYTAMSEISAMSYSGDSLEYVGSIDIKGRINNQYNLDEYEGILRVVTTTSTNVFREYRNENNDTFSAELRNDLSGSNASLYCIDLSTWKILASVENFAPQDEEVQSVRFDKDKAYVCTAIVLSDPVFVFDLSDLNNITYKDTGTITGYSISLINFGEGFLLGVGYGNSFGTLKLEIYEETETGVASVCTYEVDNCEFATDYKSYFIDREKHLIGIGYMDYGTDNTGFVDHYTLFQFDGYDFVKVLDEKITGENDYKRAVLIDGYFYMFGTEFVVKPL